MVIFVFARESWIILEEQPHTSRVNQERNRGFCSIRELSNHTCIYRCLPCISIIMAVIPKILQSTHETCAMHACMHLHTNKAEAV